MERIKSSKREKRVLRTLSGLGFDALGEFDAAAIRSLVAAIAAVAAIILFIIGCALIKFNIG